VTVRNAFLDTPFRVAVTTTASSLGAAAAVALTLADVEPAGTVTELGKVRLAELSERVTLTPPLGATALRSTEQVAEPATGTLVGLHCTDVSAGTAADVRVIEAVLEVPA
jgi:hypothetical protein